MLQVPVALAQAGPYHGASVRVIVGSKSLEASLWHLGGVPGAEMNVEMWGRGSYLLEIPAAPFSISGFQSSFSQSYYAHCHESCASSSSVMPHVRALADLSLA